MIETVTIIACDRCINTHNLGVILPWIDARHFARQIGWGCPAGHDYCPDCWKSVDHPARPRKTGPYGELDPPSGSERVQDPSQRS